MPTVILLDVSLSMVRPVTAVEPDTPILTRHNLAIHGINAFLDYLSLHTKLEFVAMMAFSSLYEVVCGFTRDYDSIKSKSLLLEEFDKTCIETALHGVSQLVLGEWGNNTPCQVLLITDGNAGIGPMSLKHSLANAGKHDVTNSFPVPFAFPGKLNIAFISPPDDPALLNNRYLYQKLVDLVGPDGGLYIPEGPLSMTNISTMFQKLAEDSYASFNGSISCGNLVSRVLISPAPMPYTKISDFETQRLIVSNNIRVCGFISVADVGSPMAISRHLVLPIGVGSNGQGVNAVKTEGSELSAENDEFSNDEGKVPSFCVLLHGALKVENMAALVLLGDDWFGFLYSWADTKKKSNLMLTVLMPGADAVPWLGDYNCLGPSAEYIGTADVPPMFPVKPIDKKSYSQNCVNWIKQAGLQSDIQKILRHARKLPEKTQQFYKELNKLRRAAISIGFMELLDGLAYVFERECTLLPANTHADCALQLTHASTELRKSHNRDVKVTIMPLQTKYTTVSQ